MSQVNRPNRRVAIPPQRGRKLRKTGGRLRPFCGAPGVGPPRCDIRPPASKQPKRPYQSVPDRVVDARPPVRLRPLTAAAENLLELYFRYDTFVGAAEPPWHMPLCAILCHVRGTSPEQENPTRACTCAGPVHHHQGARPRRAPAHRLPVPPQQKWMLLVGLPPSPSGRGPHRMWGVRARGKVAHGCRSAEGGAGWRVQLATNN